MKIHRPEPCRKQKVQLQALVRLRRQGELRAQEFQKKKTVMKRYKENWGAARQELSIIQLIPRSNGGQPFLTQKQRLLKRFAGGGKHIKLSSLLVLALH